MTDDFPFAERLLILLTAPLWGIAWILMRARYRKSAARRRGQPET